MGHPHGNGDSGIADDAKAAERLREVQEAVRDVPEPDHGRVTDDDVKTLRAAQLDEVAEIAEKLVGV